MDYFANKPPAMIKCYAKTMLASVLFVDCHQQRTLASHDSAKLIDRILVLLSLLIIIAASVNFYWLHIVQSLHKALVLWYTGKTKKRGAIIADREDSDTLCRHIKSERTGSSRMAKSPPTSKVLTE